MKIFNFSILSLQISCAYASLQSKTLLLHITNFSWLQRDCIARKLLQEKISVYAFIMQWSLAFLIKGDERFQNFQYFFHKSSDQLRVRIAAISDFVASFALQISHGCREIVSKEAVTREKLCLCFKYIQMVISFLDKGR